MVFQNFLYETWRTPPPPPFIIHQTGITHSPPGGAEYLTPPTPQSRESGRSILQLRSDLLLWNAILQTVHSYKNTLSQTRRYRHPYALTKTHSLSRLTHIRSPKHTCTHTNMLINTHTHPFTLTHMLTHTLTHPFMHANTHTLIHSHTCSRSHTHSHTHTPTLGP